MTQLFSTHLVQKVFPPSLAGQYDPEQELWVGDNQLEGRTETGSNTKNPTEHPVMKFVWSGLFEDAVIDMEPDEVGDSDSDSDNP